MEINIDTKFSFVTMRIAKCGPSVLPIKVIDQKKLEWEGQGQNEWKRKREKQQVVE